MRTTWDAHDIERRLCAALDIARQSVERLAANGYTDSEEPAISVRPEKLIGETALFLYAASAVAERYPDVGARIDAIARLLIPHARGPRILLGMCVDPSLAFDYAEAHICLGKLGYRDPGFDALLRQSLQSQAGTGRERVPYRALEQQWIGNIWKATGCAAGYCPASPPLDFILKRPLDVFGGGLNEPYAFTHALMYVRDFNIRPRRLPRPRAAILAEAEAALARCLDEENYDLGGEVLMAWPLTGGAWSAGAAFGFRVLAGIEDRNGILPSPGTRRERLDKLEGEARTDYWLATAYHTVYVMGLLCAAALHPKRAPPARLTARAAPHRGAADAILRVLDSDGQRPCWRRELDRIPAAERDALAGFLLDVALTRKVRRREFGEVHALLKTGYAFGLAGTPASSQAAEMLERLATYTAVAGAAGAGTGVAEAA